MSLLIDGDTIFKQDVEKGTIKINDKQYDIAEPIHPWEFIPFLFSISDWNDTSEQSLLYLIPESFITTEGNLVLPECK